MNATFKLTEDQEELIHRIFGGEEILTDQVQTINTGGGVMNDLYPTKNGHLVVVFEYGACFVDDMKNYEDSSYQDRLYDIETPYIMAIRNIKNPLPMFSWDEPLEYTDEQV
jgi:hypothetical protein